MAQEPMLVLKLSAPEIFQCSACDGHPNGDFAADGWAVDVVEAFQNHVRRCHSIKVIPEQPIAVSPSR